MGEENYKDQTQAAGIGFEQRYRTRGNRNADGQRGNPRKA
jgi:hypothetical protein